MIELLGTIFGSIFSGGATGLVGVIVQRWADYKNRQLDIELQKNAQAHEAVMREKDAQIMAQEWAARTKVAEVEGETKKEVAESEAFGKSFGMEPPRFSDAGKLTPTQHWFMVALDFARGIVRPGLTVYLCAITTLVYLDAKAMLAGKAMLTGQEAMDLTKMVVGTVLYLTTTCVLWWFGTRNKQNPPKT